MTGMRNDAKMWAWGAGILGIILVVCGFLSQSAPDSTHDNKCKASNYTWASVIIGFIMLLAGFMTLMKMNKKPGMAASSASMIGGMGGVGGDPTGGDPSGMEIGGM